MANGQRITATTVVFAITTSGLAQIAATAPIWAAHVAVLVVGVGVFSDVQVEGSRR
jgi:hypothetical protein